MNENMSVRDRQQRLLEYVNTVGVASIDKFSSLYGVSDMTIRRDIEYLAQSKLLVKVRGGARRFENSAKFHETHLRARMKLNVPAKQRLAEEAASLIGPGDTLFLDGSTTVVCLAQVLARSGKEITVVTNSTLVSLELAENRNIRLIGLGGVFDSETFSFCRLDEGDALQGCHVQKAFLSCTGLIVTEGTYENSLFNKPIKRSVARGAESVYLLADGSKLGRKALNGVLRIDDIDVLITDGALSDKQVRFLAEKGVEVRLVRVGDSETTVVFGQEKSSACRGSA